MTRPTAAALGGCFALVLVAYAADGSPRARAVAWGQGAHLWRWELPPGPEPGPVRRELAVVARSRRIPADRPPTGPPPLVPPGAVAEQVLLKELLHPGEVMSGRVTLQLHNLRALGVSPQQVTGPLRMTAGTDREGSEQDGVIKVDGHSLLGRPVAHEAGWDEGELPLLSFRTAGTEEFHEWTVLLAVRPE